MGDTPAPVNQVYTSTQAAKSMLAALRYLSVLPRTVRMDFSSDFIPGGGATVNVLKPVSAGAAKVYTPADRAEGDPIKYGVVSQEYVPVKLENALYNAIELPDEWATFDLKSLTEQVLIPQAKSVVDGLPVPLVTLMEAVKAPTVSGSGADVATAAATALKFYDDGSNALKVIGKLRARLNANKVPLTGRTLAVGPGVEAAILSLPQLQKVNEAGTSSLLREATIGRLFGFDIVAAFDLAEDKAVAYQKDAFAFVTRVPRLPGGAPQGATVAQDGYSLRHIMHYNPTYRQDQSVVDTFYGATVLEPKAAIAAGLTEAPSTDDGDGEVE